jgi:metalloendopeptidase OMA1, mitochondrial
MRKMADKSHSHPASPPAIIRVRDSWVFVMLLLLCGACEPEGQGPGHRQQPLAISSDQELQVGRQAYEQIMRHASVVSAGGEVDVVARVGKRLARVVENDALMREINLHVSDRHFDWEYNVIAEDQINAFCLPGGEIFVFSGLLKAVNSEDQLAAVVSHEVAHTLAHHASERIARERTVGSGLLALAYNREQESEADHIGLFLTTFAGYDPQAAAIFWREMSNDRAGHAIIPEILSDHPSDSRRLARLQDWIPQAMAAKRAWDEGRITPKSR